MKTCPLCVEELRVGDLYSEIHTIEQYLENGDALVKKTMAHLGCVLRLYDRLKAANAADDLARLSKLEAI